ncbi:hypothetical protein BaRGS_00008396, partial [Batillaria attramentaria]
GSFATSCLWSCGWPRQTTTSNGSTGNARMYAVLCLSDSLAIVHYIVMYTMSLQFFPYSQCSSYMFQFVGDVFCYYSDYVIILIGLQQLVAVKRPLSASTLCRAGHQWWALVAAFLFRLLFASPFGIVYIEVFYQCRTGQLLLFDNRPRDYMIYVTVLFYIGLVTDLLPLLLLLVVNLLLIRALLSLTQEAAMPFAAYVVFLIILIPGLVCNLLSLVVWVAAATTTSNGSTGNARMYAVLCLSDSLAIVHYIVMYTMSLQFFPYSQCSSYMFQFVGDVFCYYSDYVIILIGLQQLVAVKRPLSASTLCRAGHQWWALVAAFLFRLLFASPFGIVYIEAFYLCRTGKLLLFDNRLRDFMNYVTLLGYIGLVTDLLPLLLLLVVNLLLIRALLSLTQVDHPSPTTRRLARAERRTKQLVVAVSVPAILKYILVQTGNIYMATAQRPSDQAFNICRDFVVILSASINVVFYSFFGDGFRSSLAALRDRRLVCNLLSLVVWVAAATTTSNGSTSNARMYAVLCLSDSLAIVHYIVMYTMSLQFFPYSQCSSYMFQFVGDVFCYYSDYVIILIGLQQLVAVKRPLSASTLCRAGHQWWALVAAFLFRLLVASPFGIEYIEAFYLCRTGQLLLFDNRPQDYMIYVTVLFYIGLVTDLLPLLLLLVVNLLLIRAMLSLTQVDHPSPTTRRLARAERRTKQLVVAVSVPAILKYILLHTGNIYMATAQRPSDQAFNICRDFVVILSASINVVFYSFFGDGFRSSLAALRDR